MADVLDIAGIRLPMIGQVRHSLLAKGKEAALTAVQTYNNPLIKFKSESFIVLMTIAWTYLLHAYYSREGIDFRYLDNDPKSSRRYARAVSGGFRWWDLAMCIRSERCPLDKGTSNNLRFLLGLRHEIEHHRPPHLDDHMSGRYLACALNFEYWITTLFGEKYSLRDSVALALQFGDLSPAGPEIPAKLPKRLSKWVEQFDGAMTPDEYNDPRFAMRLVFTRKLANRVGQADLAIEFVKAGAAGAEDTPTERWVVKDIEKPKHRPKAVVRLARDAGYDFFGMHQHTLLWQRLVAKNPALGFGIEVEGTWYWYDSWVEEVLRQCQAIVDQRISIVAPRRQ